MAESADYDPGPWKGHDFKTARKAYDANVGRAYSDAVDKDLKATDLVPKTIETDSESPVVIVCDGTGSMGDWPATIFSKLPYLDIEGREYLGETMKTSFAVIGDSVMGDKFGLQVQPFAAGKDMEKHLKALVVEGGGGSNAVEGYDLAALYYGRNCSMPKAVKPIMIFIGDEGLYDQIDKSKAAEWTHVDIEKRLSIEQVFEELKQKFSVYLVRKLYDTSGTIDAPSASDKRIQKQWEDLLGADHVSILPSADRVVDVIFGIFAKETGKIKYFKKELTDRQEADKVDVVMKSLKTIHKLPAGKADDDSKDSKSKKSKKALPAPNHSMTRRSGKTPGKDSMSLG